MTTSAVVRPASTNIDYSPLMGSVVPWRTAVENQGIVVGKVVRIDNYRDVATVDKTLGGFRGLSLL